MIACKGSWLCGLISVVYLKKKCRKIELSQGYCILQLLKLATPHATKLFNMWILVVFPNCEKRLLASSCVPMNSGPTRRIFTKFDP